jgi:hypothetical protein
MFWKRTNPIRVEIVNPINAISPKPSSLSTDQGSESAKGTRRIDTDLTFKFATFFALVLQAVLIVWGYLELAAYYEQFGIRTSELNLGTPTLLIYGYSYTFSELMSTVDRIPVLGAFIPGLTFITIGAALTFLFFAMHERRALGDIFQRGVLVGVVLLLIFLAPTLAVRNGVDRATKDFEEYSGVKAPRGLDREYTVVTDQKETLTGHLIVADTRFTFIQVNGTVYKLDNSSNRVMRRTVLKPKPEKPVSALAPSPG